MKCICPFCGSDKVHIIDVENKYSAECECGARGSVQNTVDKALGHFNKKTDLEIFKTMLNNSEFSNYYTVSDGTVEYNGSEVSTKDLCLIRTTKGIKVTALFSESTEDLLGVLLETE